MVKKKKQCGSKQFQYKFKEIQLKIDFNTDTSKRSRKMAKMQKYVN